MVTPNEKLPISTMRLIIISQVILFFVYWFSIGFKSIPNPIEIVEAIKYMQSKYNLTYHFITSIIFCLKAIFFATLISIVISYLSLMPVFKPVVKLITKFRFLGVLGLSFYVLTLVSNVEAQKMVLMIFSIGIFLMTAIQAEITSPTKDELDYGKTLGFSPWRISWEINILSKIDRIWEIMKQNFAIAWVMLPAIEYLAKSSGGIGVLLVEANKYMKVDWLWAVQVLIILTGIIVDSGFKTVGKFLFNYSPLYR